jgi:transposase
MKISTIGIDVAKNVFAIHGIEDAGNVGMRRTLRRGQFLAFFRKLEPCLIGMEACATAHYWARELVQLGHEVRLMPPSYVKPYVKRGKSDGIDAAACCEAVGRPTMRFVPIKSEEQQSVLSLHRTRALLVRQRTQTNNVLRSLCAEFGVVGAKGAKPLGDLAAMIRNESDGRLPAQARLALMPLADQLQHLARNIAALDYQIVKGSRSDEACRRLQTIPGIGPITASAVIATIGNPERFRTGRDLAAWIGLTRRANATGGKDRPGPISKQGDRYLRQLFVQGAAAVVGTIRNPRSTAATSWLRDLAARKNPKLAIIAQANKMARVAWAVLTKAQEYRADHAGTMA